MTYKYFLVLSFLCVVEVLLADQKLCNKLKPCGDRGVCGRSTDEASKHLLTIKCFCRFDYTGQWCQYVDDNYQPGPKGRVPGKPKILTDTKVPSFNQKYPLKFKGVPPGGQVLYYLLRYTDVITPQGEWRSVAVENKGGVHKLLLDKLDWGHKYKLELYAGNTHGLGEPARRTLKKPKVSEPKMMDVSKDLTGSNAVCCGKPLRLQCKAKGRPQPTYSWYLNGRELRYVTAVSDFVAKGGILTIPVPLYKKHQGEYRCLASNAWGAVLSRPIQVKIIGRSVKGRAVKKKARLFSQTSLPPQILYLETNLTMNCGKKEEANDIMWYYNGIAMRNPGLNKDDIGRVPIDGFASDIQYKLHEGRVQLVNTKPIGTGIYQCDVTTGIKNGIVSKTRYVQFRDFDRIEPLSLKHKASNEVRLKEGSTATLTCSPTPSDAVEVIWKNISRKTGERCRKLPNGSLEIRDISQSESTLRITCEFSSDKGVSAKRSIGIHVAQSVSGGWSSWDRWQPCRGKGCVRPTRVRKCNNPAPRYDGKYCPGLDAQESGVWSGWSAWKCVPISGKCGKHVKIRTRKCKGACPGKPRQIKTCSRYIPCPVNGVWTVWNRWSECTKSCYPGGTQSRVRKCRPPRHGGKTCKGSSKLRRRCNTNAGPCPINGGWSTWSSWTPCSTTCNAGLQMRSRKCSNPVPKHGGEDCHGTNTMTKECTIVPCKVDGGWSAWSDFGACSVSCGAGVKYSTRMCNNPMAEHGGKECEGNSQYRTQCDMSPCKVNGGWSTWGTWSECSTTCGSGVVSRGRNCSDPEPKYGGQDCEGKSEDGKKCHMKPCPVHGRWSLWGKWSSCSVTCDSGVRTRVRSCTRPEPAHGGNKCHGKHEFQAKCHHKGCKGTKGEGQPDVKLAKTNSGSSSNNSHAMIYTFVGGIGGLVFLGILFCGYRAWYLRSLNEADYMPLTNVKTQPDESLHTKVKTQPVEPKSILKNKRESTAIIDSSELSPKSTRRSSGRSDTSDVPTVKRGSLPPPPPPLPTLTSQRPTRGKRHSGGKTRQSTGSKKETPKDGAVGLDETALDRGKAKDMPVHKTSKDSGSPNVPNSSPVSSSNPKGSTSSDIHTLEKAVLESGKVGDAQVHRMASANVPEASPNGDKIDLPKVGNAKDNNGQNVVKQDSSSLFVPKRPSEPAAAKRPSGPAFPSGPSSGKSMGSEDIYGGLIGFENAILETGDDQINVKKATIQKIKVKK